MQNSSSQNDTSFISNLLISTALTRSIVLVSLAAAGTLASSPALAVGDYETPQGGSVVGGTATIDTVAKGELVINQSTDRTVIDWNSFNIGTKASTEFVQPTSNALAVNRVNNKGSDPTQILGTLRANGRVVVLDRNGVIFGRNARVDVGGIIASTGDVDTKAVMAGGDKLTIINNGSKRSVENHGRITVADSGLAALVAPSVRNDGTITAHLGRVGLASGDKVTVDLYGDKLIEMTAGEVVQKALIEQDGVIDASGGLIQITASAAKQVVDSVVNLDGITSASSVKQDGGRIILSGGTVNINNDVTANGRRGGEISVKGSRVNVGLMADVTANSTAKQAAGTIKVIATDKAYISGDLSAMGSEDTGFIETSAPTVDFGLLSSVQSTGEWLLDPTNITIDVPLTFMIEAQLAVGDMTVTTPAAGFEAGNIIVERTIDWATDNKLTLNASNDILLNAYHSGIDNTGSGDIVLNAGRDVVLSNGSGITTDGGDVTINSDRFKLTAGEVNTHGGDITINNSKGFQALSNSLSTSGTGNITVHQNKDSGPGLSSNTIQNAINAIRNTGSGNNRVIVGAGTFNEAVTVNRKLSLEGANAGIAGDGARGAETVIVNNAGTGVNITANNAVVDGVQVSTSATGIAINATGVVVANNLLTSIKGDAIEGNGAASATVVRNAVRGAKGRGIDLANGSNNAIIAGNSIRDTGSNGIAVTNSSNVTTTGNMVARTGNNAISYLNSTTATITGNYVGYLDAGITSAGSNNIKGDGILVENSSGTATKRTLIAGNKVTGTQSMAWDNGSGIELLGSRYVDIVGNTLTNTGWDGVRAKHVADTSIMGNTVGNVTRTGIYVGAANNVAVAANMITGTKELFGIHGDSSSGLLIANNTIAATANDGIFAEKLNTSSVSANTIAMAGDDGIAAEKSDSLVISTNRITGVRDDGISLKDTTGNTHVLVNTVIGTGDDGITATGSSNVTVSANAISDTGDEGIDVDHLTGKTGLTNNMINRTGSDGIAADHVASLEISGNAIGITGAINGDGIYVSNSHNSALGQTVIKSNTITNTMSPATNKGSGIQVEDSEYVTVGGASVDDANTIRNTAWDGVRIDGNTGTLVAGNKMTNVKRTGIYLGNSRSVSATGNSIAGNSTHYGIDADNNTNTTITDNTIASIHQDGIYLHNLRGRNLVSHNNISMTGDDGIAAENVNNLSVLDNSISGVRGDGIDVASARNLSVRENYVANTGANGIYAHGLYGTATISANSIENIGDTGIRASNADDLIISDNWMANTTNDGIFAYDVDYLRVGYNNINNAGTNGITVEGNDGYMIPMGLMISEGPSKIYGTYIYNNAVNTARRSGIDVSYLEDIVDIKDNSIRNVGRNGIELDYLNDAAVISNTVTGTGNHGVYARNVDTLEVGYNTLSDIGNTGVYVTDGDRKYIEKPSKLAVAAVADYVGEEVVLDEPIDEPIFYGTHIHDNTITSAKVDGVYVEGVKSVGIENNEITTVGHDGISAYNVGELDVGYNTVTDAGSSGIRIDGSAMTFPDYEEGGEIALLAKVLMPKPFPFPMDSFYGHSVVQGNTITNATTGMTLANGLVDLSGDTNSINGGEVGLRVTGTNVDLKGNTIGTTAFTGQTGLYVELQEGALFAPDAPTVIDGLNASYDGLTPALTGGVLTAAQFAALEDMIWHYNDDATLGLFYFGSVPLPTGTFEQADAFNTFSTFVPTAGRVGLTITGLPRLPGARAQAPAGDITNPDVLNTLSPAAGPGAGELPSNPTAEQVAAIEPAAGPTDAACWGDASALVGSGRSVNYSFTTDPSAALSDAATCGSRAQ